MLQQIQRDAFARQQNVSKAARAGDDFSGFNFFSVRSERLELLLRIQRGKNFFGGLQPSDYHLFGSDKTTLRPLVAHQHALGRDIAAAEIFTKKEADTRIQRALVQPVHESASNISSSTEVR